MPKLCELPNLMTNFNQLVLQDFEIQKLYVCFDLPLSSLNRVQAESINDLDNYLMAKSLHSTSKKHEDSDHKLTLKPPTDGHSEITSQGTPILNLLHEYKQMQEQAKAVDSFEEHKEVCKNLEQDFLQQL